MNCNNVDDIAFLKSQLAVARNEISNLRQQLITTKHAYRKECDDIRDLLENWRCLECRNRQDQLSSNPTSADVHVSPVDLSLRYIGMIHTQFPEKRGTPRQPGICSNMSAKITLKNVFTNPEHALEGLQEYSHMWILFHFHKNDSNHIRAKVAPPRLNGSRTGIFATRSPHRPCPIGLSLVKIDRIMDSTIYFSGVDMVDQTPVIDIKPYIPQYDSPSVIGDGNDYNILNESEFNIGDGSMNESVQDLRQGLNNISIGDSQAGTSGVINVDAHSDSRSVSRMGEREAPDGEEEENPQQVSVNIGTPPHRHVQVPNWVNHPPTLSVYFTQRALLQLQQFGNESDQKRIHITSILQEDPRSVYLRSVENTNYVFRIADLNVSCNFDDPTRSVTVFQVFQDSLDEGFD